MSHLANRMIVAICALVLVAGVAHDLGAKAVRDELATRCQPQANEQLQATIQTADGVTCVYAAFPHQSKRTRRAT